PHMQGQGGGVIINTAGKVGIRPARGKNPYSTAKTGGIKLTRAIALGYTRGKICCNANCPGFVVTPLTDSIATKERDEFLAEFQPLKGLIRADEVASLAVYLASDASKMITGQFFTIDGGQQAGIFA